MAARVRVRVNGSDAGKPLKLEEGMTRAAFVAAAKAKLLGAEAGAAVDDDQVKLYLHGSDEVDDLNELVTDDVDRRGPAEAHNYSTCLHSWG